MIKYGVKLNSGKVLWILADDVRIEKDVVLFLVKTQSNDFRIVAGFNLREVHHFADPTALTSNQSSPTGES